MSYYPGCDDNEDSNESPKQLALDAAYARRAKAEAELEALALEQRTHGRNIVQGVYYADHDRADIERGRITERCMGDMDRMDAAITRMTLADVERIDICQDCGEPCDDPALMLCSECMAELLDRRQREAEEMRREVA